MFKFKVDNTELLEDIDLVSKSYQECMNYLKAKLPDGREKNR